MAVKMEKKYVLTNRRSGKMLAACNGAAVQMTEDGSDVQIWRAVPAEGTAVQLVNKATGLALTVSGEAENGTVLTLAEPEGSAAQLWKLTTTTRGFRKVMHAASARLSTSRTSAIPITRRHSSGSSSRARTRTGF